MIKNKKGIIETSIGTVIIIILSIAMLILGVSLVKNAFNISTDINETMNYTFVLNGENVDEIIICENFWHYERIEGFIPCVLNGTVGGIGGETIDWTLSPQDNCNLVNAEFTGLNIYNLTRSKELYDLLLPECFDFKETDVSNIWLNVSKCSCLDDKTLNFSFSPNCLEYDCGGGLFVNKK